MLGLLVLETEIDGLGVTVQERSGRDVTSDLLAVEGDGVPGVDGSPGDLSGRRIDAGSDVDGHDLHIELVDLFDQPGCRWTWRSGETRAEQCVDDQVRFAEILLLLLWLRFDDANCLARFGQNPGGDAAVSPVVSWTADDRDRLRVRVHLEDELSDRLTS